MSTVLITGANRGIGFELCRHLTGRGDRVIAACREPGDKLARLDVRIIDGVDVCSDQSVASLKSRLGNEDLDWLINNAGILYREIEGRPDFSAMEHQFRVNSLGPLRVTFALVDKLRKGSKIGIITSRMGSIGDNTSGGYYGYRMSKTAVNIAGVSLARDLQAREIAVALLHPGYVATGMTDMQGVPVAQAASGLIQRMDELDIGTTGGFWHAQGERLPW